VQVSGATGLPGAQECVSGHQLWSSVSPCPPDLVDLPNHPQARSSHLRFSFEGGPYAGRYSRFRGANTWFQDFGRSEAVGNLGMDTPIQARFPILILSHIPQRNIAGHGSTRSARRSNTPEAGNSCGLPRPDVAWSPTWSPPPLSRVGRLAATVVKAPRPCTNAGPAAVT